MIFKRITNISLLIVLVVSLVACSNEKITIISPLGSPTYATIFLDDTYEVETVLGPDPLIAAFGSKNYDVIIAPTNLGAKFYNNSDTYQLIATITWGNVFLISASEISLDTLEGKNITAFGQNQTPDIVMKYILEENDIQADVSYVASTTEILASYILNPDDVYMIAEPQYSILEATNSLYSIDLQLEYENLTGHNSYPQSSIFAHKDLSDHQIDQIKSDFESSILTFNDDTNTSYVASFLEIDIEIATKVISRSNLMYKDSMEAQNDIELYLDLIISYNSELLSELPDSAFYR